MKVEATSTGLLVRGILGSTAVPWDDLYLARIEAHTVSFIFLNQRRRDRTSHARVPLVDAASVLRSSTFPLWLVDRDAANREGLSRAEADKFGPPPTTHWVEGVTRPSEENWRPDDMRMRAWFPIGVSRVGVFDKGVAFDTRRHGRDIVALNGLVGSSGAASHDRYCFGVVSVDPEGSLAYVVTSEEARAILQLRPRESWSLPNRVWASLGM